MLSQKKSSICTHVPSSLQSWPPIMHLSDLHEIVLKISSSLYYKLYIFLDFLHAIPGFVSADTYLHDYHHAVAGWHLVMHCCNWYANFACFFVESSARNYIAPVLLFRACCLQLNAMTNTTSIMAHILLLLYNRWLEHFKYLMWCCKRWKKYPMYFFLADWYDTARTTLLVSEAALLICVISFWSYNLCTICKYSGVAATVCVILILLTGRIICCSLLISLAIELHDQGSQVFYWKVPSYLSHDVIFASIATIFRTKIHPVSTITFIGLHLHYAN